MQSKTIFENNIYHPLFISIFLLILGWTFLIDIYCFGEFQKYGEAILLKQN